MLSQKIAKNGAHIYKLVSVRFGVIETAVFKALKFKILCYVLSSSNKVTIYRTILVNLIQHTIFINVDALEFNFFQSL